ncbi:hypothetical protein GQX74_004423 [Glossina fuscipes]|nr:hypothetical protein GQX74_004423 [Glossina fuscipes]
MLFLEQRLARQFGQRHLHDVPMTPYEWVWPPSRRHFDLNAVVYFSISSLVLLAFIGDEWEYVMGEQDRPRMQFRFNIAVLICSVGLVISSAFMICGLIKIRQSIVYCLICVASQYQVFKECERLDNRESISNEDLHVPINMPIANLTAAPLKRTHKSIFPTIIEEVA